MKKNNTIYHLLTIFLLMLFFRFTTVSAQENTIDQNEQLGYSYNQDMTTFKVWSSSARSIKVVIEGIDNPRCPQGICSLAKGTNNVWIGYSTGDLIGKEYSFVVEDKDGIIHENILDPYGKYLNETGDRNIIYDDTLLLFEDWNNQTTTISIRDKNKVIYGVNVENFTKDDTWHGTEQNKGKLAGLIESGTKYSGVLTGYDHIKSLGITYIELSKVFSSDNPFAIDKNIVAGSSFYSGNLELKRVVNNYYLNGIGTILTFDYQLFSEQYINNLKIIDPSYVDENGAFLLNSEQGKKIIKDILVYYVENYKLAGIKIDNMSNYSLSLISDIIGVLNNEERKIMIYGDITSTDNTINDLLKLTNVGILNGSLNYSLLGNLNNLDEKGILDSNYSENIIETLKYTLLSGVDNGQIDYSKVKGVSYLDELEMGTAYQLINYLGAKNGLSMFDKLFINNLSGENLIRQKAVLAFSTMMISGGIPYIYSGNEFLVSYLDLDNTGESLCNETAGFCFHTKEEYKLIDWSYAQKNQSTVDALKALINFRKSSNSVAQSETRYLKENVEIYTNENCIGLIGFVRKYPNAYNNDVEEVFVVVNYSNNDYVLENMSSKGVYGLYKYNASTRDGETLILKANSFYSELKEKQPKINSWVTLIIIVLVIGGIYSLNIMLNKKIVEKNGYDIKNIKKKYRPFINKDKIKNDKNDDAQENESEIEESEENKNGN